MHNSSSKKNSFLGKEETNKSLSLFNFLEKIFKLIVESFLYFITISWIIISLFAFYQSGKDENDFFKLLASLSSEYFGFFKECFFFSTNNSQRQNHLSMIRPVFATSFLLTAVTLSIFERRRGIRIANIFNTQNTLELEKKFNDEKRFLEEKVIKYLESIQDKIIRIQYDFLDIVRENRENKNLSNLHSDNLSKNNSFSDFSHSDEINKENDEFETTVEKIRNRFLDSDSSESDSFSVNSSDSDETDYSEESERYSDEDNLSE